MNTRLEKQFNTEDTMLVISGWPAIRNSAWAGKPEKGKNESFVENHGIAWYTKASISPMAKKFGQRFVVLAEKNCDNDPVVEEKGKILILRVFDKKRHSLYPQILTWLIKFNQVKKVQVHSEFGMKGGVWHFALLVPFLAMVRGFGKKITFFSHNVIDDVSMLSGHLNLKQDSLMSKALNLGLKFYYWSLAILCSQIAVLDETLATRLEKFVSKSKIAVLPMAVEKKKTKLAKQKAKSKLGIGAREKVILYFGFVTWYKGADWLVEEFDKLCKESGEKIRLVLAGGESYSLADQEYYQNYYAGLKKIADKNPQIDITGFVAEKDVETYFASADLVVFSYRGLMGASGCMNHAMSYGKPFMVSDLMNKAIGGSDAKEVLNRLDMKRSDLVFPMNGKGMSRIVSILNNSKNLSKLTRFSKSLAQARDRSKLVATEYLVLSGGESKRASKTGVLKLIGAA